MELEKEILAFTYINRKVRYSDYINYFVGGKKCSKQTFIAHKKALEIEGKLKKDYDKEEGAPVYYVAKPHEPEAAHHSAIISIKAIKPKSFKEFSIHTLEALDLERLKETMGFHASPISDAKLIEAIMKGVMASFSCNAFSDIDASKNLTDEKGDMIAAIFFRDFIVPILVQELHKPFGSWDLTSKILKKYRSVLPRLLMEVERLEKTTKPSAVLKKFLRDLKEAEKIWLEDLRRSLRFKFHIVLTFNGENMAETVDKELTTLTEEELLQQLKERIDQLRRKQVEVSHY
jgi:hypothetical protein